MGLDCIINGINIILGLLESLDKGVLGLRDLNGAAELDLVFQSRLLLYSIFMSPRSDSCEGVVAWESPCPPLLLAGCLGGLQGT